MSLGDLEVDEKAEHLDCTNFFTSIKPSLKIRTGNGNKNK